MSWVNVDFGEVVELRQGMAFNKKNRHLVGNEGIPILRIVDLNDNSETKFIKEELVPKQFIASKSDIIFSRTGIHLGLVYTNRVGIVHNNCFRVIPKTEDIDKKYLYWYLKQPSIIEQARSKAGGSAQPDLNHSAFKSIAFNYPKIKIQKRIADILSAYDDLIENNLKRIKLLEQVAQNIYKEWFVNMRFPSHENTPIDQETGLPEGWKTLKFDNVFNVQNGYAFKSKDYRNKGIPVLRTRDYSSSFFIDITDPIFLSDEFSVSHKKYFVKELDFLLIMVGASIGNNGLVLKKDLPALQNQNQWAIRVKSKFHSYEYFKIYCVKSIIDSLLMKRTGSARDFFRASFIKEIDVIIPDEDLVKQFTKFVKPLINQINILLTQNQKLISARDILLPRLMNQTIKV